MTELRLESLPSQDTLGQGQGQEDQAGRGIPTSGGQEQEHK